MGEVEMQELEGNQLPEVQVLQALTAQGQHRFDRRVDVCVVDALQYENDRIDDQENDRG
jgi:hypothetical protein